jgi:hypothetical protein
MNFCHKNLQNNLPKTPITFIQDKELAKQFDYVNGELNKSSPNFRSIYYAKVQEINLIGLYEGLRNYDDLTIICGYPSFYTSDTQQNVRLLSADKFKELYPNHQQQYVHNTSFNYYDTIRSKDIFNQNCFILIDIDDLPDDMHSYSTAEILDVFNSVTQNCFVDVLVIDVASSSNGIIAPDGTQLTGHYKRHLYLQVIDSSDTERFTNTLFVKLINAGYQVIKKSSDGKELVRTLFDKQAISRERLCYEAKPNYQGGLTENRAKPQLFGSKLLDTRLLPDLTDDEIEQYNQITGKKTNTKSSNKTSFSIGAPTRVDDLEWNTIIKLSTGVEITPEKFKEFNLNKSPCYSPFRDETNPSAFLGLDSNGNPFCYDAGEEITHFIKSVEGEIVDDEIPAILDENNLKDIYTLDEGFEMLNKKYAIVLTRNGAVVMEKDAYNASLNINQVIFYTERALKQFYSHKKVKLNNKLEPLFNEWFSSNKAIRYTSVVFNPLANAKIPNDVYNLYRGITCKPKKGNWRKYIWHLHNIICGGDKVVTRYLIAWMANMVQGKPKPGVAIVLQGEKGTGKSLFVTLFGLLFGRHFLQIVQSNQLVGNFNAHLREAYLVFAEEAFYAGDKQAEGALKALITEPMMMIESKGVDIESIANYTNIIFATNHYWSVPATANERRYCVLNVSNEKMQNHQYFKLLIEQMLEEGGLEAMYYDLLHYDLTDINLKQAPVTSGLAEQIYETDVMLQFLIICIEKQSLYSIKQKVDEVYQDVAQPWGNGIVTKETFRSEYKKYANSLGHRYIETDNIITKKINLWVDNVKTPKPKTNGSQVPSYWFPSIQSCKNSIDKKLGTSWAWNT